jgi:lipid-A-disaccharide synthase
VARSVPNARFIISLPADTNFRERFRGASIQSHRTEPELQVREGRTWDALAAADLAIAASGTVTIEAAILGTPLIAFYRVNPASWFVGRRLVRAPFLSMVNLVAGRRVAPELIQRDCTPDALASEAIALLNDDAALHRMRADLADVKRALEGREDPMQTAAASVLTLFEKELVHAS